MASHDDTDAQIFAYLDGEMDASAQRAFEQRLAGDADLRAEVEGARAVKSLMGTDAAWGKESGTDAPPPHLMDAILRAEAIARPKEIREAAALTSARTTGGGASFTAKMARWLLGGGVLVGGAAAVLFVVTRSSLEPQLASPSVAVSDAVAEAPPPPPQPPADTGVLGEADRAADKKIAKMESAKPTDAPAEAAGAVALGRAAEGEDLARADNTRPQRVSLEDKPKPDSKPASVADGTIAGGLAQHTEELRGAGGGARVSGSAGCDPVLDFDCRPGARAKDSAAAGKGPLPKVDAPAKPAEKTEAKAARPAQDPTANAQPPPAPVVAATPPATPAPEPSASSRSGASGGDAFGFDKLESGTADDDAQASESAPKSRDEARRELYKKRVEEKSGHKAPPAARKAPASAGEKAKQNTKSDKNDAKKVVTKEQEPSPQEVQAAEEANMAFTTGVRELQGKHYAEALDSFQSAERLDCRHTLGAGVVIGQMRAYSGLKRLPDVARLAGRLVNADVKNPEVVSGMMLGVDAAEKTGDATLAELLWTRLLEVPDKKDLARRALDRMTRANRNRALDNEAPAAAAPADASKATESQQ